MAPAVKLHHVDPVRALEALAHLSPIGWEHANLTAITLGRLPDGSGKAGSGHCDPSQPSRNDKGSLTYDF
jgi:hypothetical protein